MSAGGGRKADPWSIGARLAVLFTLSACVTLGMATSFLYEVLTESLEKDDFQLLADKVYWLRANLSEHPSDRDFLRLAVQVETGATRPSMLNGLAAAAADAHSKAMPETSNRVARYLGIDF